MIQSRAKLQVIFALTVLLAGWGTHASAAGPTRKVGDVANGRHSYRKLGNAFSVPLPMERVEGARLLLFNDPFARELRIKLPDDPSKLAEAVLAAFAHRVKKAGSSGPVSKTLFATYYQDSTKKGVGDALGDGRAAWFGEIALEQTDGTIAYVDVVGKGIGQTPLAWLNHARETHRDGLMYRNEGIHDFITSEVAYKLGLETNRTLAVIEIPDLKMNEHAGRYEKAIITIRIGPQFRPAHLRYYTDDPPKLREVSEYLIRRMLRLGPDAPVGPAEAKQYLEAFADKMGEQAALYKLLEAVQRNPTAGNRTLVGGAIDTGTFRFLDANHPGYPILSGQFRLEEQREFFTDDISFLLQYLRPTGLLTPSVSEANLQSRFARSYETVFANGVLQRLGLSDSEIRRIPSATRLRIANVFDSLFEARGKTSLDLGAEKVVASAYDTRHLFARFWETFVEGDEKAWKENVVALLRERTRSWQGLPRRPAKVAADQLVESVNEIFPSLGKESPRANWFTKARALSEKRRPEPQLADALLEEPIERAIAAGNADWPELTAMAEDSIDALVDDGLEPAKESAFGDRRLLEKNRIDLLSKKASANRRSTEIAPACAALFAD